MRATTQDLIGLTVHSLDGPVGSVKDLYFDDETWNVQYVVVETGKWLNHRHLLIESRSLKDPIWNGKILLIGLTRDQVEQCPDVSIEKPVYLQKEEELERLYRWPRYWGGTDPLFPVPRNVEPVVDWGRSQATISDWKTWPQKTHNQHLRSGQEVIGYSLEAENGIVGKVIDLVVDDTDWSLPFLAVELQHWLEGKIVYVSTRRCQKIEIDWSQDLISVDMTKNEVKYRLRHVAPDHLISKVGVKLF